MYKAIKDKKIIAISDTDSEFYCLIKDEVIKDEKHSVKDYEMVGTEYVLKTNQKAINKFEADKRSVRDSYLKEYVDTKQLVLVWNSLSEEEKTLISDYRTYLLDYPQSKSTWYKQNPLTLEEWKKQNQEGDK